MCPEPQNLDDTLVGQHLVDDPVLNVDTAGIAPFKIAHESLEWRWTLKWIILDDPQQLLRLGFQTAGGKLLRVFSRLLRVDEPPTHQSSSSEHSLTGSSMPSRIDSRMPGIESRYSVS